MRLSRRAAAMTRQAATVSVISSLGHSSGSAAEMLNASVELRQPTQTLPNYFADPTNVAVHVRGALWSDRDLLDLGAALGGVTWSRRNPEPIRRIRPLPVSEAPPNTLSSRFGRGAFPFHTDGAHWRNPPKYLLLCCEAVGPGEQPTLLKCVKMSEQERAVSQREPWTVFDGRRSFLTTLLCRTGTIRYDAACMSPAVPYGQSVEVINRIVSSPADHHIHWEPRDLLIVANRRCLHGRAESKWVGMSCAPRESRSMVRVLVGGEQ